MTVDEVRDERIGAALVVTIDRQHRRNAIDGRTADALVAALDRFEADDGARVLVLTGAGEAFCSGADLTALESLSPRLLAGEGPLGFTRRVASKPAIAAIDGWAVAGGLELALWCDLRVVSPRSQLGCLERRFGVPLVDGGTWRWRSCWPRTRSQQCCPTGRRSMTGMACPATTHWRSRGATGSRFWVMGKAARPGSSPVKVAAPRARPRTDGSGIRARVITAV